MKIPIPKTVDIDMMGEKEKELIKLVSLFPKTVNEAARELNPALVANYVYELAKEYNQFYHEFQILREENGTIRELRLVISREVANVIRRAFWLLGIDVPQRM